jgi:hypothetical protein
MDNLYLHTALRAFSCKKLFGSRFFLFFALLYLSVSLQAQYRTEAFHKNIKTIRATHSDGVFALPVLTLNGSDFLTISFDELSADIHDYYYSIYHCSADWKPSPISTTEWCRGYAFNPIVETRPSINTTVNYSNYSFTVPNSDFTFKASGNYVAVIIEGNDLQKVVATICFSVVEQKVAIMPDIRSNTDTDFNGKSQQLDFTVLTNNYPIQDVSSELKIVVQQNRRTDNQPQNLQPTYITPSKLSYVNNKALIFEGGNEYKGVEITSSYSYGAGVNRIRWFEPYFNVELFADQIAPRAPYSFVQDSDGNYVVNVLGTDDDDVEADYVLVHFTLEAEAPFFDGLVYILGAFNHDRLDDAVKMTYNNERKCYEKTILLKQGGYNYQYAFIPVGSKTATMQRISGSYWQTENQYAIYVYHRPFGERYDKLVGFRVAQSMAGK